VSRPARKPDKKLTDERLGEPSADIQARVEAARECQRQRFDGTDLMSNADMGPSEVRTFCPIDDAGKSLLRAAMHQLQMSARAYHRILKLSRTIADSSTSSEQAWRAAMGSRRRILRLCSGQAWRRRSSTGLGG
jgi:magnesium chelatase family protein